MHTDKEFFAELDKVAQSSWKELTSFIKTSNLKIRSIEFDVDVDNETIKKYGLNSDFTFVLSTTSPGGGSIEYYYKGMKMEPECYYIRPEDYHNVDTLTILHQCIVQDTHKPDIMFLERGESEKTN